MMPVYSREYYQAGLAKGTIKAKKLDSYRLGPDFVMAYDLGPAAPYRTLLVDRKQGEIVLKATTKTLLAHFVNEDLPGGYPLQEKLYKLLAIREKHVISAGHGALFSPESFHAGLADLVALQQMRGMEACQGGMLMTDLAGVNCYFFELKRGYARASRQVEEAVEHNALYCSLFHGLAGQVGCPVCRQGDWNLLYGPSYQRAVEAELADKLPSLKQLLAEIRAEKAEVFKEILLAELKLPVLPDDLDYALKQAEKKFLFRI